MYLYILYIPGERILCASVHTDNDHKRAQFSGEELSELRGGSWENPAFDNMDQLMDERLGTSPQNSLQCVVPGCCPQV